MGKRQNVSMFVKMLVWERVMVYADCQRDSNPEISFQMHRLG